MSAENPFKISLLDLARKVTERNKEKNVSQPRKYVSKAKKKKENRIVGYIDIDGNKVLIASEGLSGNTFKKIMDKNVDELSNLDENNPIKLK